MKVALPGLGFATSKAGNGCVYCKIELKINYDVKQLPEVIR